MVIELNIKLLIVGDSNVGKTSLLLQYTDNYYPDQHTATIGFEYKIKIFQYKNYNIKLQIWDTAGQERFHSITNNFFHNADGILFVYDITNRQTFDGVKVWIKEAEEIGNFYKRILIGNKCDLSEKRNISIEELENYCMEKNMQFFETSAKENIYLVEAFNKIVDLILEDKTDEEIIREFGVKKSSLSISSRNLGSKKNNNKNQRCC